MKPATVNASRFTALLLAAVVLLAPGALRVSAQEATTAPEPPPAETVVPPTDPAPEATATPEPAPELTAEPTAPPTAEPTLEPTTVPPAEVPVTAEPTIEADPFTVESICTEQGAAFVITNNGPDMSEPAFFRLTGDFDLIVEEPVAEEPVEPSEPIEPVVPTEPTDVPAEDVVEAAVEPEMPPADETPAPPAFEDNGTSFQLASGESITVLAGIGSGQLVIGEVAYVFDAICASESPALSVSAVCTFETGVTFTVANDGGPMSVEQAYSVVVGEGEPLTGTFLLGANETVDTAAGYGTPSFTSEDLASTLAETCFAPAEVSGVVWADADGDGLRTETDPGIPGVSVQLVDSAGFMLTVVTGDDGAYEFGLLPTASLTVQLDPASLPVDLVPLAADEGGLSQALDVLMGLTYTADFGFAIPATASVSGTVWLETGNFGVRDAGEMGVVGAQVELVDAGGAVVATAPVDLVTGAYTFTELRAGDYMVQLARATLFTPNGITFDSDGDFNYDTAIILMTGQALTGIDFGVVGTF